MDALYNVSTWLSSAEIGPAGYSFLSDDNNTIDESAESEDLAPALSPPQFGLRELFWFVAFTAILLVAVKTLPPLVSAVMTLFALAIFAHVIGNALGSKLRDHGNIAQMASAPAEPVQAEDHFAPTTELSDHRGLSRLIKILSGVGAGVGCLIGGGALAVINWENATIASVALAALACSVLGGLFGFLAASFLQVTYEAWMEAVSDEPSEP
ncbi:MAG: hypothetical protein AAF497_14230 [Planctomycetota bacterium]